MLQRLLDRDRFKLLVRRISERPARRGQNQSTNSIFSIRDWAFGVGRSPFSSIETLEDRVVLAIDGKNLHSFLLRLPHHNLAGHYEDFLAPHREIFSRLNRRQRRLQSS